MIEAIVSPDQDLILVEIDIAAPPERVFKAIHDPEEVHRRAPQLDAYDMDLRIGGRWFLEMRPPQPYHGHTFIRHKGKILEVEPPRLLVYTWTANFHNHPKQESIVRWELTPTKSGTHVKLTHTGLGTEPQACKDYGGGWPGVLEELKGAVEGSKK